MSRRSPDAERRRDANGSRPEEPRAAAQPKFEEVIDGYGQMTPAMRLKAKMRYMLSQATKRVRRISLSRRAARHKQAGRALCHALVPCCIGGQLHDTRRLRSRQQTNLLFNLLIHMLCKNGSEPMACGRRKTRAMGSGHGSRLIPAKAGTWRWMWQSCAATPGAPPRPTPHMRCALCAGMSRSAGETERYHPRVFPGRCILPP